MSVIESAKYGETRERLMKSVVVQTMAREICRDVHEQGLSLSHFFHVVPGVRAEAWDVRYEFMTLALDEYKRRGGKIPCHIGGPAEAVKALVIADGEGEDWPEATEDLEDERTVILCRDCDHEWESDTKPLRCPECSSKSWRVKKAHESHEGNAVTIGEPVRGIIGEGQVLSGPGEHSRRTAAGEVIGPYDTAEEADAALREANGIAGDQNDDYYVMTVSCYVNRECVVDSDEAGRLATDQECRDYVREMRERVDGRFGIDLVVPDDEG